MTYVVISINGQKAVDAGYKFQRNACYRGIYNHGKRIAQLEVVIDEPGEYNGLASKWVAVTTDFKSAETTINQLRKIGFAGCPALIEYENDETMDTEFGCWLYI